MQNTTEITGLKWNHRLERLLTSGSYPVQCLWYGLGGLLAALAKIAGQSAPFGAAYLAAVPFRFTLPATLGTAIGYMLGSGMGEGFRPLAAGFIVTLLRWLLRPAVWQKRAGWLTPLAAAGATLAAGVLPMLYRDPLIYDLLMWATQIIIAAAAAGFFARAMSNGVENSGTTREPALWVLLSVGIMGLCAVPLGGTTLGELAAVATVLLAAYAGGVQTASMMGVVCGLAISFATGSLDRSVTLFGLGGLMAGIFGAFGRLGSAAAFTAAYGIADLLSGSGGRMASAGIASVGFLMLPQGWLRQLTAAIKAPADGGTVKSLVCERLERASHALRDLGKTTSEVAKRLGKLYTGDVSGIYDRVSGQVCKSCSHNAVCWQQRGNETVETFAYALRRLAHGETLAPGDLDVGPKNCVNKTQLAELLTLEYLRYSTRDEEQRRTARIRRLMGDQLDGVALALDELLDEVEDVGAADGLLAAKADTVLEERRLEPYKATCWRTRQGRLRLQVELPAYKEGRSAPEQLAAALGEALGTPLGYPEITRQGKTVRLVFAERPRYSVEYGSCQLNCRENPLCGDSFRILNTGGATANMLLSDGMGSGSGAAVDSAMAASLAVRLLEAGLSYPSVLKLINGALLVKSGQESLATLDAAQLDLYTGRATLYKAGAAPTVVRREGRGAEIDAASLPAGIMEGVEFATSHIDLGDGDLLLLLSDGAVPEDAGWIVRAVEGFGDGDLDDFCRKLATSARLRRTDGRDDDITVLCCRVTLAS